MTTVQCPVCSRHLKYECAVGGQFVKCTGCGDVFRAPDNAIETATDAPSRVTSAPASSPNSAFGISAGAVAAILAVIGSLVGILVRGRARAMSIYFLETNWPYVGMAALALVITGGLLGIYAAIKGDGRASATIAVIIAAVWSSAYYFSAR